MVRELLVQGPEELNMPETVAEWSTTHPHAVKVFQRHGIDFCCGAGRSLAEACLARALDPVAVVAEIAAEEALSTSPARRWDQAPLEDLIEHLLVRYHAPLREDLARLEALATKVARVHGEKDPRLVPLLKLVLAFRDDLLPHLAKEEQVLFPWILRPGAPPPVGPVRVMTMEHDDVARLLGELVELTDGFAVPPGACGSWTALWTGLEVFDRELREHIALENNVLFARTCPA